MLFDGIRDQKLKVKWVKTPQAISVRIMCVRCLRDKVPKGQFIIRAGVLDRLIKNKMQYKFVEHGQKMKDQLAKEKMEEQAEKAEKERLEKEARLNMDTETLSADLEAQHEAIM